MEKQSQRMKSIICSMDEKNIFCIDCGIDKIDYVSVNNGIIICSDCYEKHKNLGYNISYLKSFSEKWDNYLLKFIQLGGNSNFFKFLYQYNLNELSIEKKYKTKAVDFYRQNLKSEVMGFDSPQINFTIENANEIIENIDDNYPEFKNYTYVKQVDIEALEKKYNKKSVMSNMSNFFENFGKKIKNSANNFAEKMEELKVKERMLEGTQNAINKVKNITVEAKDKIEGIMNKNKYSFMNDKNFTNKVVINTGEDSNNNFNYFKEKEYNEKNINNNNNNNLNKNSVSISDFLNNNNINEKNEEKKNSNNENKLNDENNNDNNKNNNIDNENNNNNKNNIEKIDETKKETKEKNLNPEDELLKKISELDDD